MFKIKLIQGLKNEDIQQGSDAYKPCHDPEHPRDQGPLKCLSEEKRQIPSRSLS